MTEIRQNATTKRDRATKTLPVTTWIGCARCDARWTGLSACHCGSCHRTFTGLRGFDIHRSGGRCNDPAAVFTEKGEPRLIHVNRKHWSGWAEPGEDTRWNQP